MSKTRVSNWWRFVIDGALEISVVGSFTRIGFAVRKRLFGWDFPWRESSQQLEGKVIVVTGATGGIGGAVAKALANMGATVWATGRDLARTEALVESIRSATKNKNVFAAQLDLNSFASVREFAARFSSESKTLDVLIHNAGALMGEFTQTEDGLETTAQTHVVAPFLLTQLLRTRLANSRNARVLWTSSGGMYAKQLEVAPLARETGDGYNGSIQYSYAKRAQVILAELSGETMPQIAFNTMHPGWVSTPGFRQALPGFYKIVGGLLRTPEQGADTLVWLASKTELQNRGEFWLDRQTRHKKLFFQPKSSVAERDKLWNFCVEAAGLASEADLR